MFCTEKSQGDSWNYEIVNKGDRYVGLRVYHVLTVKYFIVFLFFLNQGLDLLICSFVQDLWYFVYWPCSTYHIIWLSKCLFIPISRQLTIIRPEKKNKKTPGQKSLKQKNNAKTLKIATLLLVQIGLPSNDKWQDRISAGLKAVNFIYRHTCLYFKGLTAKYFFSLSFWVINTGIFCFVASPVWEAFQEICD